VSYAPPLAAHADTARPSVSLLTGDEHTYARSVVRARACKRRPRVFYSYQDIVALRMFVQLRGHLSLQKVRKVASYLLKHYPDTHLASHSVRGGAGGRTAVWVSPDGEVRGVVERARPSGLKLVMDDIFRSFTTGTGQRVPDLAEPAQGVTIDLRCVRLPVIEGTPNSVHGCRCLYADGMTSGGDRRVVSSCHLG